MVDGTSNSEANQKDLNSSTRDNGGYWLDWVSTTVSTAIIIVLLIVYINFPDNSLLLAGLFGAVLGWACGIFATPYTKGEGEKTAGITKVVSGVASGYVVAKLDRVFDSIVPVPAKNAEFVFPYPLASHFAVCFIMFVTIFIFYTLLGLIKSTQVHFKMQSKRFLFEIFSE